MLYKSPVWKKNCQNFVKTTSFETYFSKRDASSFFGGRGKILNLQGQNLFRGCPLPPSPNGRKLLEFWAPNSVWSIGGGYFLEQPIPDEDFVKFRVINIYSQTH